MEKKRILLVNKFYYPRGGDCICTLNLERLLHDKGHEVAVYAMQYPENIPSPWSPMFAPQIDFGGGAVQKVKALQRTLGLGDIRASFARMLAEFKPDIVHLNNIHSYLSPRLALMAKKAGARVVWTLHDYKLICPSYSMITPDGEVCEACLTRPGAVIERRCMKGSLVASLTAYAEGRVWNRHRLSAAVDRFICPSGFMRDKMEQGGYPAEKLTTLCNFMAPDRLKAIADAEVVGAESRGSYYCYVGRLLKEKGVEQLLKVASQLPYTLKVAGTGPLEEQLRKEYAGCDNIEFLGFCDGATVSRLLSKARFSIVPSQWYENNPLSVIESLSAGTPVVGSDMGGIPELLSADSGIVFSHASAGDMIRAIEEAWRHTWDYAAIREKALEAFSPESHYAALTKIYSE